MPTIAVFDETTAGTKTRVLTLDSLEAKVTARELIRMRVYQEVQDYNRTKGEIFRGLVQPTATERVLNGYKVKECRQIDWEEQFKKAVEAFASNGFIILVDKQQVDQLDQVITLGADTEVSFLKLVPLVGG